MKESVGQIVRSTESVSLLLYNLNQTKTNSHSAAAATAAFYAEGSQTYNQGRRLKFSHRNFGVYEVSMYYDANNLLRSWRIMKM